MESIRRGSPSMTTVWLPLNFSQYPTPYASVLYGTYDPSYANALEPPVENTVERWRSTTVTGTEIRFQPDCMSAEDEKQSVESVTSPPNDVSALSRFLALT
jgi:hypothetical protein